MLEWMPDSRSCLQLEIIGPAPLSTGVGQVETTGMNISPSSLSWGLIPMSLVHLVSSAVLLVHCQQHTMGSVSSLWPAIFFPGGFILMFVVGMLIVIRRGERTHYEFVDKAAVVVAAVAIAVFVTIVRDIATSPNKAGATKLVQATARLRPRYRSEAWVAPCLTSVVKWHTPQLWKTHHNQPSASLPSAVSSRLSPRSLVSALLTSCVILRRQERQPWATGLFPVCFFSARLSAVWS